MLSHASGELNMVNRVTSRHRRPLGFALVGAMLVAVLVLSSPRSRSEGARNVLVGGDRFNEELAKDLHVVAKGDTASPPQMEIILRSCINEQRMMDFNVFFKGDSVPQLNRILPPSLSGGAVAYPVVLSKQFDEIEFVEVFAPVAGQTCLSTIQIRDLVGNRNVGILGEEFYFSKSCSRENCAASKKFSPQFRYKMTIRTCNFATAKTRAVFNVDLQGTVAGVKPRFRFAGSANPGKSKSKTVTSPLSVGRLKNIVVIYRGRSGHSNRFCSDLIQVYDYQTGLHVTFLTSKTNFIKAVKTFGTTYNYQLEISTCKNGGTSAQIGFTVTGQSGVTVSKSQRPGSDLTYVDFSSSQDLGPVKELKMASNSNDDWRPCLAVFYYKDQQSIARKFLTPQVKALVVKNGVSTLNTVYEYKLKVRTCGSAWKRIHKRAVVIGLVDTFTKASIAIKVNPPSRGNERTYTLVSQVYGGAEPRLIIRAQSSLAFCADSVTLLGGVSNFALDYTDAVRNVIIRYENAAQKKTCPAGKQCAESRTFRGTRV